MLVHGFLAGEPEASLSPCYDGERDSVIKGLRFAVSAPLLPVALPVSRGRPRPLWLVERARLPLPSFLESSSLFCLGARAPFLALESVATIKAGFVTLRQ